MRIILASGSPRRRELLSKIYKDFEVIVSDCDENVTETEPDKIVQVLAERKAKAVYDKIISDEAASGGSIIGEDILVIGADTIVYYDGEVLGKPVDEEDARGMLSMLSERTHQVYTGVALFLRKNSEEKNVILSDKTDVVFYNIDKYDISDYIKSGSPMDKAGAYGIQDDFAKHVRKIDGDYNNVVGLPVSKLFQELRKHKLV